MKQINWETILANVVYKHEYNDVIFNAKDVEKLHSYLLKLNTMIEGQATIIANLRITNTKLENQVLQETLKSKYEKLSKFVTYA